MQGRPAPHMLLKHSGGAETMMQKHRDLIFTIIIPGLIILFLTGCGGGGGGGSSSGGGAISGLGSIAIQPTAVEMAAGQTQQFTATGTNSNGSTSNITTQVAWHSDNESAGTIDSNGLFTALNPGTVVQAAHITATAGGITSNQALVTVAGGVPTPSPTPPPTPTPTPVIP